MPLRLLTLLLILSASCAHAQEALSFVPSEDGLYAVFDVTLGATQQRESFVARLYYDRATLTVAWFAALAEGRVPWYASTDTARTQPQLTPFYNNRTFHRIINGFVIQGGSEDGLGFTGSGNTWPDEIDWSLSHNRAGLLSMANSGPNTNSSQFFITVQAAAYPTHLDGNHSIFGEIVHNQAFIEAIADTPSNATSGRPNATVTLHTVSLLARGFRAEAFRQRLSSLPARLTDAPLSLYASGDTLTASAVFDPAAEADVFGSTDLIEWERIHSLVQADSVLNLTESVVQSPVFFRSIAYQGRQDAAASLLNRRLVLTLPGLANPLIMSWTQQGGVYTFDNAAAGLQEISLSIRQAFLYPIGTGYQLYVTFAGNLAAFQIYLPWDWQEVLPSGTAIPVRCRIRTANPFNSTGTLQVSAL